MSTHALSLPAPEVSLRPALPRLGGRNPADQVIGITNASLTWNGAPWLPVSGEIHYSRLRRETWKPCLQRMKAGGIDIASTYVFWIHHEEIQGHFDWTGSRDLRVFLQTCAEAELHAIVRIGPFCHGEVRNGGLPDWLYGRSFRVRSNDDGYLAFVKCLYGEIAGQLDGLYFKDGGPIIGIQLENELLHAGAPWETTPRLCMERIPAGFDGVEHLRRLKTLAVEAGMIVPLYTVTGWGGAAILEGETLPLYGGYAYCPWNVTTERPTHSPTSEYVFRDFHALGIRYDVFDPPYDPSAYPFACCELGGGMQSWYGYRFVVDPRSPEAMALVKIAGGCSLLGYYMYQGGTNPAGKRGFLNEHVTPRVSYDFQAPLGEFGQVRESAHRLRRLHLFLRFFGQRMVAMGTILPDGAALVAPSDTRTIRYAARARGDEGFLFLCNFQDHVSTQDHPDIVFTLPLHDGEVRLPRAGGFTLRHDDSVIMPFNLRLADLRLLYSTAQPLGLMEYGGVLHSFFFEHEGIPAELCLDATTVADLAHDGCPGDTHADRVWLWPVPGLGKSVRVTTASGRKVVIHTLTELQSLGFYALRLWGRERIVMTAADLSEDCGDAIISVRGSQARNVALDIFPPLDARLASNGERLIVEPGEDFSRATLDVPANPVEGTMADVRPGIAELRVAPECFRGVDELLLNVDYDGDVGNAFVDGSLVADNFANGAPWEIGLAGLREDLASQPLVLRVTPRREGSVVVHESAMAMKTEIIGREIAEIRSVHLDPVRVFRVVLER